MLVGNKVVVVTGGASGIGRALAHRFAHEGARTVVVADLDAAGAAGVAGDIGDAAVPVTADVASESSVLDLIERTEADWGPIDLFCSNAGIFTRGGLETPQDTWERMLSVNFMSQVDGVMEPDQVADAVIEALDAERFLVLPHPEVAEYVRRKGEDRERWLAGMRRLQAKYGGR